MAIQNIDNYEVYRSYQDKANEYEQKAGEKLADLGMDAISTATPYVSAGITRSAKMAFQAAEKAREGTRVMSKSYNLSSVKGGRIDVENPGTRPGQIHLQIKGDKNKYYYNSTTNQFHINKSDGEVASKSIQKVLNNSDVKNAIIKAKTILGTQK